MGYIVIYSFVILLFSYLARLTCSQRVTSSLLQIMIDRTVWSPFSVDLVLNLVFDRVKVCGSLNLVSVPTLARKRRIVVCQKVLRDIRLNLNYGSNIVGFLVRTFLNLFWLRLQRCPNILSYVHGFSNCFDFLDRHNSLFFRVMSLCIIDDQFNLIIRVLHFLNLRVQIYVQCLLRNLSHIFGILFLLLVRDHNNSFIVVSWCCDSVYLIGSVSQF